MIRRTAFAAILAAAAFPQTAFADIVWPPPTQKDIATLPAIGETATVAVAGTLLQKFEGPSADGAVLEAPVTVRWSGFVLSTHTVEHRAGTPLIAIRTPKFMACAATLEQVYNPIQCFIDENDDGSFDHTQAAPVGDWSSVDSLPAPVPYKRQRVWYTVPGASPIVKTVFVYLGSNGTSLHIGSRTSIGTMERPGQSFTIPLGATFPQPFAIGEFVFTLTKVDGMGITVRRDK